MSGKKLLARTHCQTVTHYHKGRPDQLNTPSWSSQLLVNVFIDAPAEGSATVTEGDSQTGGALMFWTFGISMGDVCTVRKDDVIIPGQCDETSPPEDGDRYRVQTVTVHRKFGVIHHVEVQLV